MKKLLSTSIFLLFFIFMIGNVQVMQAFSQEEMIRTLDRLMEEKIAEYHIPNAAISVVYDDEVIFAKGYGFADMTTKTPVDPETSLFRIGSISKLLTWTAVMQLVEQGKLDLDTDVNEYLDFTIPAYEQSQPITLRHLLTHTPGFEDYANKIFLLEAEKFPPLETYVRETLPARIFPAGEVLAYSNYGTALAGYIVERVSGMPFTTYVAENIFQPLKMEQSTFEQPLPAELANQLVTPYRFVDGEYKAGKFEYMPAPAGAISSSALDMANFMRAFLNEGRFGEAKLLEAATVNEMLSQQFTYHPELNGMTFGFIEGDTHGQRVLMHGGSTMLYNSILYLLPEEKLGIFITYSGGNHLLHNEVLHAFMDTFYQQETFVPEKLVATQELKKIRWRIPAKSEKFNDGR